MSLFSDCVFLLQGYFTANTNPDDELHSDSEEEEEGEETEEEEDSELIEGELLGRKGD